MPYRNMLEPLEDPDLDRRELDVAVEIGRRRSRLVAPLVITGMVLTLPLRLFFGGLGYLFLIALAFATHSMVRWRLDAWAEELARRHQIPDERMRELMSSIRLLGG